MTASVRDDRFSPYVPRLVVEWQSRPDAASHTVVDGTVLFADISGFTRLSDELAMHGTIGSEELTIVLNQAFTEQLDVAARLGGDLLHFGGDALFLFFGGPDHAPRAARAAFEMRNALDAFQATTSPVPLTMSMGLASGPVDVYLAGADPRFLVATGATVDTMLSMEAVADAGQILMAPSTAALVGAPGRSADGGTLLRSEPQGVDGDHRGDPAPATPAAIDHGSLIPRRLHDHLTVSFNEGLHRLANIAFVKLSGLAAASAGDDVAVELDRVVTAIETAADRYGVSILAADVSGDGAKLMMATGIPERTDAEEERILRAVAEIAAVVSPIEIAAGAARGRVFACDLGSPTRRVYTTIGATVNLAARLAGRAGAGKALVTRLLLDRSSSVFQATRLAPMQLKGKSQPIAPFELGKFEAGPSTGVSTRHPLLGRDAELHRLTAAVAGAELGSASVIELVADSGMGKTRLVQELVDLAVHQTVTATAEPYESSTAYFVAGQVVRRALDIAGDSDPATMGATLSTEVSARAPELAPWLPLVARVIGATVPDTAEVAALDDEFQASKTAEVVSDVLTSCLEPGAIVVVDATEWADAASADVLRRYVADVASYPQVVCLAGRSESRLAGERQAVSLGPLPDEAARQLVGFALGEAAIPVSTRDQIVERAGGVPAFILALAASALDGDEELPETIEAAGEARIDHLDPPDRRLLRYASVLGREFTPDLLIEAAPDIAPELDDRGLWRRLGEFLETTATGRVRFRNPILRDVAYNGLPFARRADLHRNVGEALERRAGSRPERFAELLALHFGEAGDHRKAWTYARIAGDRARALYAHTVAAELYRRALRAAEATEGGIPESELGPVVEALGDATDSAGLLTASRDAYEQALGMVSGDPLVESRLLRKKAHIQEQLGDYDGAMATTEVALACLEGAGTSPEHDRERFEAMLLRAGILNRKADPDGSVEWCLRVLAEADPGEHPAVVAHACYLVENGYTRLNHPDRGTRYDQALAIYRRLGDLSGEAKVLNNLGTEAYFRGEWEAATRFWEGSAEAADRSGDVVLSATLRNNLAEIDIDQGRLERAEDLLRRALDEFRGAGYKLGVAFGYANLARIEVRSGRTEAADMHLDEAEQLFDEVGSRYGVIDVQRRRAEGLLAAGDWQPALTMLDTTWLELSPIPGMGILQAAVQRLRGFALSQAGDDEGARAALTDSLGLAIGVGARYEEALTLDALSRHATARGSNDEWGERARAILTELGADLPPRISV
jgi:class 3 adenylate cyclase/tetratricopeptide (TPR) repeat protein